MAGVLTTLEGCSRQRRSIARAMATTVESDGRGCPSRPRATCPITTSDRAPSLMRVMVHGVASFVAVSSCDDDSATSVDPANVSTAFFRDMEAGVLVAQRRARPRAL